MCIDLLQGYNTSLIRDHRENFRLLFPEIMCFALYLAVTHAADCFSTPFSEVMFAFTY